MQVYPLSTTQYHNTTSAKHTLPTSTGTVHTSAKGQRRNDVMLLHGDAC